MIVPANAPSGQAGSTCVAQEWASLWLPQPSVLASHPGCPDAGFTISGQSHALAHAHTHLQVPASWSSTYTAGSIGMVQPGGAALPTYVDGSSQVLLQPGTSVQGRGRALAEQPTALVYPGQYMQYMMPAMHTGSSGATVWLPAVPQHMWGAGYAPAPGQLLPTSPYSAQGAPPASQGLT